MPSRGPDLVNKLTCISISIFVFLYTSVQKHDLEAILVKKDLLSTFKITIEDNSEDGILWIRFTEIGKS
jgi:hypothetical protein